MLSRLGAITLLKLHPRLVLATLVGVLAGVSLQGRFEAMQCAVLGWDIGVWLYLAMIWHLMARSDEDAVKHFAEQEDENATTVLTLVCVAALASLAAIVVQLGNAKELSGMMQVLHYTSTVATVFGSWLLVGTIYAVHYTKLFYTAGDGDSPLRFPEENCKPHYWDFLYFSFTISTAAQTSDIAIVRTSMRKIVVGQSVLAFLFNAAILGLSINIAAGLIGH